jgi:hypothetical protein
MITFKRFDADDTQILDDGKVVAHALRLTNNRWALFDANDRRLSVGSSFNTSAEAARTFHPAAVRHVEKGPAR